MLNGGNALLLRAASFGVLAGKSLCGRVFSHL
jgi:hypothetical protein